MAEIKTLRVLANQMRAAAKNLNVAFGDDGTGAVIPMGAWRWDGDALPELPALQRDATARQRRDHRYAESLRTQQPGRLLGALVGLREATAEAVEGEIDLRAEGYSGKVLDKQRIALGERVLNMASAAVGTAQNVADRLAQVRRDLAREAFETGDPDRYMKTLGLDDEEREPPNETAIAVQQAIFDTAILGALKPLTPAERTVLMDGRALPKQLDDARVLAAVFRGPRPLLPFDDEELRAIASLSFLKGWPKTSSTSVVIEEMLAQVQPVAGQALLMAGRFIDSTNPYDAFRRVPGGRWAIQSFVHTDHRAADVAADLNAFRKPT